jgi:hypothetical protein
MLRLTLLVFFIALAFSPANAQKSLGDELSASIGKMRERKDQLENQTAAARSVLSRQTILATRDLELRLQYAMAASAHNSLIDQVTLDIRTRPATLKRDDYARLEKRADDEAGKLLEIVQQLKSREVQTSVLTKVIEFVVATGIGTALVKAVERWILTDPNEETKKTILEDIAKLKMREYDLLP